MGNRGSQFESQFFKRYSFIQNIDDKSFGQVKIYRKNSVKFDYIMILQIQLENLTESQIQILEERLKLVRTHQNQSTLRVYHYKFLAPTRLQCRNRRLLVYAQYMNRSVLDYLCALRSNPKFVFDVSQIIYVLRNVSKGCIALKKMGISHPDLSSRKVFLSPEGEALLCPLLYILESLKGSVSYNQISKILDSLSAHKFKSVEFQFETTANKFTSINDRKHFIEETPINNLYLQTDPIIFKY